MQHTLSGRSYARNLRKTGRSRRATTTTAITAMMYIENDATSGDVTEEGLSPGIDVMELKRLVAQGKLMELLNLENTMVRRPSSAPEDRPNRKPGQYERLLGDEDLCTAAAETLGNGLCAQGSRAFGREGGAWVVAAFLLVDRNG